MYMQIYIQITSFLLTIKSNLFFLVIKKKNKNFNSHMYLEMLDINILIKEIV